MHKIQTRRPLLTALLVTLTALAAIPVTVVAAERPAESDRLSAAPAPASAPAVQTRVIRFNSSGKPRPVSTGKVHLDDFERLPQTVTRPHHHKTLVIGKGGKGREASGQ